MNKETKSNSTVPYTQDQFDDAWVSFVNRELENISDVRKLDPINVPELRRKVRRWKVEFNKNN